MATRRKCKKKIRVGGYLKCAPRKRAKKGGARRKGCSYGRRVKGKCPPKKR